MKVGDLVRHKDFEQYGIIENVLCFKVQDKKYAVVYWQCGNRSGQYMNALELVS
jgi:rhodanese-related sulfurtransferase